ncbi:MAG: flagellar biosynthesis anti-sigma factor FlgM [Planctomycetaceae bacterium]|nr:flagellar biosynthesis anti-sigma factor FlgM [Planctomycetaceae bacterium]
MQIPRTHIPGQSAASPSGVRKGGSAARSGDTGRVSREPEAGGTVNSGELDQLSRQLGEISEVRADVVAAAKVRVQRGDYLTRAAAENIADAILSKDA